MTRFPLFIQEMENKLFTRGFRHPTIKTWYASIT
jgi:hypothetical protein